MPSKNTEALDPKDLIVCFSCLGCLGCADTQGLNGYIGNWCTVNFNASLCCQRCGVSSCRWSDVEDECCILCEQNSKQVMPTSCCKTTGQVCCLDQRISFPAEDDEDAEIPCMLALGGINCAVDNQCRMGCCQTVHTLRHGETCSDSFPCVMGSCGDCSCLSACCTAPAATDAPDANDGADGADSIPNTGTDGAAAEQDGKVEGKIDSGELNTICGYGCVIYSLFCRFPDIFGAYGEGVACCCLNFSSSCCKPLIKKGEVFDNDICLCVNHRVALVQPSTCFMTTCQVFCVDARCAFPCNGDEVPCICNVCFVNCMYEYAIATGCTLWTPLKQFKNDGEGMANQDEAAKQA